jgi:murein DD-endopeptidase MepM/ murein hydrolase activator NlpD
MRQLSAVAVLSACLVGCSCAREAEAPPPAAPRPDVFLPPDTATVRDRVPPRATLVSLLLDLELRADIVPVIVEKTLAVFDPRQLRAGNAFELVRTTGGLLRDFQYEIDTDRYLRLQATAGQEETTIRAEVGLYDKQRIPVTLRGEINRDAPSLFAAMEHLGETPDLSVALADIFSGEIDFNTDLQPGDSFTLSLERVLREGQPVGYGPIAVAEFNNEGRRHRAFLFTPPGGKPGYYDEQGRSVRRFFLASPLKFTPRVTSGFSRSRFHPILKYYRPHLGIDYAAPMGSPVVAVANGVVLQAGFSGQGGRTIHLRHASGYETYYMHLSSIAPGVRAGAHVSQGQTIGRVGMSGMATGPHLDYRIRKNGTFMNPALLRRTLPPGEPIPAGAMAQFTALRDSVLAKLAPEAVAASSAGPAGRAEPSAARPQPPTPPQPTAGAKRDH